MKPDTFNLKTLEEVNKLGFWVVRRGFYWHGDKRKLAVGKSFRVTGAPQYVTLPAGVKVTGLDDLGNGSYPDGRKVEFADAVIK